MFGWFNTAEVDALADAIVAETRKRFPPAGVDLGDRKAITKAVKSLETSYAKLDALAASGKLNLYRKARLGNRIRWGLAEAGYPEHFVRTVTHELVAFVTVASAAKAS